MLFLVVPRGDQVHVVRALVRALRVDARLARELDLHALEDGLVRHRVDLADQLGVEVEVARERRDRDERRVAAQAQRQWMRKRECKGTKTWQRSRSAARWCTRATSADTKTGMRKHKGNSGTRSRPDAQQRRDGLVEEAGVDVGRLLEDDDVAARALGRRHLPAERVSAAARREAVLINKFTLLQQDQAVVVRGDSGCKSVTDTGALQ